MPRGDGGRRFQKGNPGGPGKPKTSPEVKELRQLDRSDLEKVVRETLQMTEKQMQARLKDPEITVKEKLAIRIALKGVAKGDQSVMGFLSDFIFGAPAKRIEVKGNMGMAVANVSQEELANAMKKLKDEF